MVLVVLFVWELGDCLLKSKFFVLKSFWEFPLSFSDEAEEILFPSFNKLVIIGAFILDLQS